MNRFVKRAQGARWRRRTGTSVVALGVVASGVVALGVGPAVASQPGDLDRSFGQRGVVTTDVGGLDTVRDVAVQSDGRIVAVGSSDGAVALVRYLSDGRLDRSFGRRGIVVTKVGDADGQVARAVALDGSGRIVVGADVGAPSAVIRYTSSGALDKTFGGGDGVWLTPDSSYIADVLVQPNGKIVTVGLNLLRLKSSGVLDPAFAQPDVSSDGQGYRYVARRSDGDYVIAARTDDDSAEIERFTPDGVKERYFRHSGGNAVGAQAVGLHAFGDSVVMVSEGVYYGSPYYRDDMWGHEQITLEKFLPSGKADPSFGRGGFRIVDTRSWPGAAADTQATASAAASDGKIVVVSPTYVARFRPGGKLDKTFSSDGIAVLTGLESSQDTSAVAAVQRDGKVVVAGDAGGDFVVQRLLG